MEETLAKLNEAKKAVTAARSELMLCERERADAISDVEQEIRQLTQKINTLAEPFDRQLLILREKEQELYKIEIACQQAYFMERFKTVPPTSFDEFKEYVTHVALALAAEYFTIRKELKPQPIPGFIIYAGRDGEREEGDDYPGAPRFYAAWNQQTNQIAGWLYVETSRHSGDKTMAIGEVDGKPLFGSKYDVVAPFRTWREKLYLR